MLCTLGEITHKTNISREKRYKYIYSTLYIEPCKNDIRYAVPIMTECYCSCTLLSKLKMCFRGCIFPLLLEHNYEVSHCIKT